jgi:CRP/FNR family transcriptional regulator, cyclic AMP receptor protein
VKLDPSAFVADPELITVLEKQSTFISCSADRVLFRQGDAPAGIYILHKGVANLTMTTSLGEEVMSIQATSGSLLGLPGLIGNEPYTLTAIACKDAEISFVTRDEFTDLMRTNPLLSLKVLRVLAAEVRSARQAIREL